jgi:hypothetical protein
VVAKGRLYFRQMSAGGCTPAAAPGINRIYSEFGDGTTTIRLTFMPEGHIPAALARFEATLESVREMQKAGWVELEIADDRKRVRGRHRHKVKGAAAMWQPSFATTLESGSSN